MELFVQDRELNISPRYLRPGFAFGGSCLPKDVKALQHFALAANVDSPLIQSLTKSNDAYIDEVANAVIASGAKTVAQVGLTFKPATDDLRESPFVKLAARLREAHIKIQAYDPIIKLEKLVGANRAYVHTFLPDIDSILVDDMNQSLSGADLIVLGNNQADVCEEIVNGPAIPVFDLTGMLPPRIEKVLRARETSASAAKAPAYTGAAW
jgi:GDP-mannose 6-dehydrogenase